jgi:NTE family protein
MARAAHTRALQDRLDSIAERLPSRDWPKRDIRIVAVDTESGEAVEFGAQDDVDLVYAVAASCALPLLWPPVSINNHSYMDGGMRSPDNADLAIGFGKVLVVSPTANMGLKLAGWDLEAQIGRLKAQGAEVHLIEPDTAARTAIGRNPLAPETRLPSAEAGLAQGRKAATAFKKFWGK